MGPGQGAFVFCKGGLAVKKVLYVEDMSCEHCVARIEKALKGGEVTDFEIDLAKKEVLIPEEFVGVAFTLLKECGYPAVQKD